MRINLYVMLAAVTSLAGCANNMHELKEELSSNLVTENYIPYPNQPYQRERPIITMKEVSSDSDFVIVETTTQYVIWKKDSASINFDEAKNLVGKIDTDESDTDQALTDELFGPSGLPLGPECRMIMNDANTVIGEVKVCGSEFCTPSHSERYSCDEVTCTIKLDLDSICSDNPDAHPFCEKNTDLENVCTAYPELNICSKATTACGLNLDK